MGNVDAMLLWKRKVELDQIRKHKKIYVEKMNRLTSHDFDMPTALSLLPGNTPGGPHEVIIGWLDLIQGPLRSHLHRILISTDGRGEHAPPFRSLGVDKYDARRSDNPGSTIFCQTGEHNILTLSEAYGNLPWVRSVQDIRPQN